MRTKTATLNPSYKRMPTSLARWLEVVNHKEMQTYVAARPHNCTLNRGDVSGHCRGLRCGSVISLAQTQGFFSTHSLLHVHTLCAQPGSTGCYHIKILQRNSHANLSHTKCVRTSISGSRLFSSIATVAAGCLPSYVDQVPSCTHLPAYLRSARWCAIDVEHQRSCHVTIGSESLCSS